MDVQYTLNVTQFSNFKLNRHRVLVWNILSTLLSIGYNFHSLFWKRTGRDFVFRFCLDTPVIFFHCYLDLRPKNLSVNPMSLIETDIFPLAGWSRRWQNLRVKASTPSEYPKNRSRITFVLADIYLSIN